jgi:hypothetical protein
MRTLLSRATRVDPSFNVGLGLVVIIAVAEIFAVTSYLCRSDPTCADSGADSCDDRHPARGSSCFNPGNGTAGDEDGSFTRSGGPDASSFSC